MRKQKKIPTIKDKNSTCPYCKDLRRANKKVHSSGDELLIHGHVQFKKTKKYFASIEGFNRKGKKTGVIPNKSLRERVNIMFQEIAEQMVVSLEGFPESFK